MLVLGFELLDCVRIGETIVQVVKVGDRVRLGIVAPREIPIVRCDRDGTPKPNTPVRAREAVQS